ncbi:MAG: hypothetical protein LBK75_04920, partial [Oscillospiraceae bacterium]|nr:hypothetical protein [Oscillospiraceae bacterium]
PLRGDALSLAVDGEAPLIYRDGQDITAQLADGQIALADIGADTTVQVIFAPGALEVSVENGVVRADALLLNRTDAEKAYLPIVAAYDGEGRLVTAKTQAATAPVGLSETAVSLPLSEAPGAVSVKVFLWDGLAYVPALPDETQIL